MLQNDKPKLVRSQVFTVASIKMALFVDGAPCSVTKICRDFKGDYCLHHHGDKGDGRQYVPLTLRPVAIRLLGQHRRRPSSSDVDHSHSKCHLGNTSWNEVTHSFVPSP